MRRIIYLLPFALLLLSNCGDKDSDKEIDDKPLTTEENKVLIQSSAVEFVDEMAALQQTNSVQSLTSLGLLLDGEDETEGGRITGSTSLLRITKSITGFAHGKISSIEFGHQTYRINQEDPEEEDFTSLEELFAENTGTHDWNPETEDFDFTPDSGDEIIVNYPSTEGGPINNASIILSNYTGVYIESPLSEEDYSGDLPTSLNVELKVDDVTEMTYAFEIDYNSEGVPEMVETTLTLNTYSLAVSLTNTDSKVGATVNFSNDSKTLIEVATEVNGDFTDQAFDDADANEDPTEVINDGNFSLTLLNLKFSAELQFAAMYNAIGGDSFEGYYDEYEGNTDPKPDLEANAELLEGALSDHATLKLTYVDTKKTAADVEWYTFVESEEYCCGTDHSIELGARMVFEDGSKMDVEDFLETGFDELETAINNLIGQIETDINEDLDKVDFGNDD